MRLQWLALTSDSLSRIARLPNLQELSLEDATIEEGKEWNMEDVTFQNLKYLTLVRVKFSEWQVDAEKSFPVLEELYIRRCDELMDIPDSFGDIASLELIKVRFCPQLIESTINIKEYVEEMTGEDKLDVCLYSCPLYSFFYDRGVWAKIKEYVEEMTGDKLEIRSNEHIFGACFQNGDMTWWIGKLLFSPLLCSTKTNTFAFLSSSYAKQKCRLVVSCQSNFEVEMVKGHCATPDGMSCSAGG
ncbi:hypothetical protein MTR67_024819 [Solanum verrucosum]|uniref:Uncharacterized protein n=1 Tax=Solanum verrucosum TaxID=315347 RepID=A0AAF0TTA7_SOLVR|nr:hypothetical protein MTR67_024819 [Solanum verrucosum]